MGRSIIRFSVFLVVLSFSNLLPQVTRSTAEGIITYFSSQNIYVEFPSTAGIKTGDTIFAVEKGVSVPAILVRFISTRSAAGEKIGSFSPARGMKVFAFPLTENLIVYDTTRAKEPVEGKDSLKKTGFSPSDRLISGRTLKNNGRFSVQSSSDFNSGDISSRGWQRWRYTLSYNLYNLANSGIDFQTYSNYTYTSRSFFKHDKPFFENLKIYNFNLAYSPGGQYELRLGRFQSNELSGLGPVDGVIAAGIFSEFKAGVVAGSRPDFSDYGYNSSLMQFGFFVSRPDTIGIATTQQSAGVFQQMNKSEIDRRFFYYQNMINFTHRLNLFFSSEFDLYKKESGVESAGFTLTSLNTSIRYSPAHFFSAGISYDARRNVIYYETYKSFLDSIIINELRRGIRLNLVIRPVRGLTIGLNNSFRSQKSDAKPNLNFGVNINYFSIPYLEASPSVSYTRLTNSFSSGYSAGLNLVKNLFALIDISAGYKYYNYHFLKSNYRLEQHVYSADAYYSFSRKLSAGLNFERVSDRAITQNRLFIDLTVRF